MSLCGDEGCPRKYTQEEARDLEIANASLKDLVASWRRTAERLTGERDKAQANVKGALRVLTGVQAHAERTLGATVAEKDRALDWICGQAKGARAVLEPAAPDAQETP